MDERRDAQPPAQAARPPLAAMGRLSPTQQAYGAYTAHAIACEACRDVDRTCPTAAELRRVWKAMTDAAFDELARETG